MKAGRLPMMNDKPPTREMCLKMAEMLFSDLFIKQAEELAWKYLFIWAMYDHWLDEYWIDK
jgi:hypothetical protein